MNAYELFTAEAASLAVCGGRVSGRYFEREGASGQGRYSGRDCVHVWGGAGEGGLWGTRHVRRVQALVANGRHHSFRFMRPTRFANQSGA